MVRTMEKGNEENLNTIIDAFFNGTEPYMPHFSLIETMGAGNGGTPLFFVAAKLGAGALDAVGQTISTLVQKGYTLVSLETERIGDSYVVYGLVDCHDEGVSESEMSSFLQPILGTAACKVKMVRQGELNPLTYPSSTRSNGKPLLTIPYEVYHAMIRIIPTSLGSGGDYILYMSGVNVADYLWDTHGLADYDDFEEQFAVLEDLFRSLGFGILAFEDLDPLKSIGRIHVRDSLESCRSEKCWYWDRCESGKLYRARGTLCTFTRGLLTEMLRRIFDDTLVDLVEITCVTKGDKECVFELTRTKSL